MGNFPSLAGAAGLALALTACGGATDNGIGGGIDARAVLLESCNTQQGIGWLKKEYGEAYCECWVDQAKEVLGTDNYNTLVSASAAELEAVDDADREKIARRHTEIYSTVSAATGKCARARRN
jgi:hypothetical protein